ncbi:DUF1217 domain-containing protein [Roseomonas eburnea]|uniref:DUF1217 domain-containing protein n=1 Tax=Neoroseomonas eburnea TaxID=1346889 RepID=A0A9X9XCG3_9PROT|nr:DUF1217 domain-containing protein [Neoroseomonas eburnea]MBR0681399.1 DUF1217 domain-containing protein [Neoroseomonas eburnea]
MNITLSQVQALFGVSSSGTTSGTAAEAIPALNRATAEGAEEKGMAREEKDPVTLSTLAQFRTALDKADTIEEALSDPRILKVIAPALGLADQVDSTALLRKALLSDPSDDESLATQLGTTWQNAAETLGVYSTGLDGLKDETLVQTLTDAYVKYQYRSGLDDSQAGMSNALYALENASNFTDVYTLLGDSAMREVVTTALGLPDAIVVQSVEAQGRAVTSRMDLDSLQDTKQVRKLVERYLIAAANEAAESASSSSGDAITTITSLAVSLKA